MLKKAVIISILSYLIFFFPVLKKDVVIYSGKDITSIHYPAKFYLHEKLQEGSFPLWTERMYLGDYQLYTKKGYYCTMLNWQELYEDDDYIYRIGYSGCDDQHPYYIKTKVGFLSVKTAVKLRIITVNDLKESEFISKRSKD